MSIDSTPHTHEPVLERAYHYNSGLYPDSGPWMIKYGGFNITVCKEGKHPSERDVKRALLAATKEHDKACEKHAKLEEKESKIVPINSLNGKLAEMWSNINVHNWASKQKL